MDLPYATATTICGIVAVLYIMILLYNDTFPYPNEGRLCLHAFGGLGLNVLHEVTWIWLFIHST